MQYSVCHKLFGLNWIESIQIVTKYWMFEPSKLITFYHKYLLKDLSNSDPFITNFSKLNEWFIIFIIIFLSILNQLSKIWTVYLWINIVKYDVDQEIMINYQQFNLSFSPFANICLYMVEFETIWFSSIQTWLVR